MKVIHEINIKKTIEILKDDGLIVFPSDTVYGLLCDATNKKAVEKLISFKDRPPGKAISIFVSDFDMMEKYVQTTKEQKKILNELLPGPFTVILKSIKKVVKELESERGSLGVRIPNYQPILKLVKEFGRPITATSANLSGRPVHYSVESLLNELSDTKKKLIDLVVDGGKLPRNKTSTVIDLTTSELKILRRGDLELKNEKTYISSSESQTKKIAKFILEKNLTDNKPLFIIIEGELGVGKTIFVKGIGEYLGIKNIISPSYVVYYEYKLQLRCFETLIHADLYNVEEENEFKHLGLERYFKKGNIVCFEWGERLGNLYKTLQSKGKVVYVKMKYVIEKKREVVISR